MKHSPQAHFNDEFGLRLRQMLRFRIGTAHPGERTRRQLLERAAAQAASGKRPEAQAWATGVFAAEDSRDKGLLASGMAMFLVWRYVNPSMGPYRLALC